jgi:hypothetical protein
VSFEKGVFYCFGCGAKGDLLLLAVMLGLEGREAIEFACQNGEGLGGQASASASSAAWPEGVISPRLFGWFRRRGIALREDGRPALDAAFLPRFLDGGAVLEVHSWCYVARETVQREQWRQYRWMGNGKRRKYFSEPHFPRKRTVGIGGERQGEVVYLTEGVLDAVAVLEGQERYGIPPGSVYYTFGTSLTEYQKEVIRTLGRSRLIVMAFDRDDAGREADWEVQRLGMGCLARLLYGGEDPGEGLLHADPWRIEEVTNDAKPVESPYVAYASVLGPVPRDCDASPLWAGQTCGEVRESL